LEEKRRSASRFKAGNPLLVGAPLTGRGYEKKAESISKSPQVAGSVDLWLIDPAANSDRARPSSSCSARLRSSPPAYPVRLPSDPTIRWHGTIIAIGLRPVAVPAARTAPGCPARRASSE